MRVQYYITIAEARERYKLLRDKCFSVSAGEDSNYINLLWKKWDEKLSNLCQDCEITDFWHEILDYENGAWIELLDAYPSSVYDTMIDEGTASWEQR